MADIEKVIKGLECCKDPMISGVKCNVCPYWDDKNPDEYQTSCNDNLCADALELLKSQQEQIEILKIAQDKIADFLTQPEIIRCKDCRHWESEDGKFGLCKICHSVSSSNGWFCADGKKRSD